MLGQQKPHACSPTGKHFPRPGPMASKLLSSRLGSSHTSHSCPKGTQHLSRSLHYTLSPVSASYGQLGDKDGQPRDPRAWEPLWGLSRVSWGTGREEEGLSFTQSRKTNTPWRQWQRREPHSKQWEPWKQHFSSRMTPRG